MTLFRSTIITENEESPFPGEQKRAFEESLGTPVVVFEVCLLSPPGSSSGLHLCVSDGFLKKETVTGTRIAYLAIMPTRRNANIQT